ncbi:tyrosine-type recombinase/integrase [Rhizobium laguerreae]|uniref:tyrosine-type recombinase/integrase n=1 Tax=Rhizobium laguerreae TaxID=1076926 RepID=UPI001C92AA0A|nr:tyrosine-type recombinase/integrase [Rhizobium laguerreae]MBY3543615.1 tyrosine-type recombinase/integrase [Rhizobium laguerreae]
MRAELKGLAKVKKVLADGKTIFYCYAWRGGPLLKKKDGSPMQPGDPMMLRAFTDAIKERKTPSTETMDKLIVEFKSSSEYESKSDKTKRAYNAYLDMISKEFGGLTFDALQDKETRGEFKSWRDRVAVTGGKTKDKPRPRTADYAWTTLARVLSVAKDRGRIAVNVCERGGRLYAADRADKIWEAEHIAALVAVAGPEVRLALMMALWTGQRQGDLLRAPWSAYDGKTLKVRQGKTGARVTIPIGPLLKEALDAAPRRSITILTNTKGRSWTEDGFRTSWGKAVDKAEVEGLTFHDLRGTAVTRLALAGCSSIQIGAITGHSPKDVDSILDAHYLGGKIELAEQAMSKLHEHVSRT